MIPGGGDPPRPKVQILDFFGNWPNNRYFSRLRRSRKRYPTGIDVLHCIAPQDRKIWSFDEFWARFCIFVMFTMKCMLIYLCFPMKHYLLIKSSLFTYDLGRGGPPPTQRTNLRFAQIVEDLKNFNFGRPMKKTGPKIRYPFRDWSVKTAIWHW